MDPVGVDAACLGQVDGQELEADDVHDRVARRDERDLGTELPQGGDRACCALSRAPLAFEDERAHGLVHRGQVPVQELLQVVRLGGDVRAFAQLQHRFLRGRSGELAGDERELERVEIPSQRIRDIPNGVPVPPPQDEIDRGAWRQRLGLKTNVPLAVFVGRLSPEKGLVDLINAWKRVQAELPDAQLVLVGSGPQQDELRGHAAGFPNILWAGATQQPQRYLFAADLFVLPSHEEGMSVSLLEAMAVGLPIVATDIPGNRGLIESGRHGLLVPPNRPDQLARSMLLQMQAKSIAAGMGRAARQRVEDEFSITLMAQRHLELFQSLIKKP